MTTDDTTRYTAAASAHVAEPPARVWAELLHPGARWMLGANIETDFRPGSPITFEGHFFGRRFEDRGTVIAVDPSRLLHFTHYSPLGELPDLPEHHHEIRIELTPDDDGTTVRVTQTNIDTAEHAARSERQWCEALASLAHRDGPPTAGH